MSQSNESIQAFLRSFNERYLRLKETLDQTLATFTGGDHEKKIDAARRAMRALDDLSPMLSDRDRPGWISPLRQLFDGIVRNDHNQGMVANAIHQIIGYIAEVKSQKWAFLDPPAGQSIEFDEVYRARFAASKLPGLFDRLVAQLQAIIDSGHVDSIKATRALERLIASIRKNAKGSFFASISTFRFACRLVENVAVGGLSSIPVVGGMIAGVHKTLDEARDEFVTVQEGVKEDVDREAALDIPILVHEPRPAASLPSPPPPGGDVIDVEFSTKE